MVNIILLNQWNKLKYNFNNKKIQYLVTIFISIYLWYLQFNNISSIENIINSFSNSKLFNIFLLIIEFLVISLSTISNYFDKSLLFTFKTSRLKMISFIFIWFILTNITFFPVIICILIHKSINYTFISNLELIILYTMLVRTNILGIISYFVFIAIFLINNNVYTTMLLYLYWIIISYFIYIRDKTFLFSLKSKLRIKYNFMESIIYILRKEKNIWIFFISVLINILILIIPFKYQYIVLNSNEGKVTLLELVGGIITLVSTLKLLIINYEDNIYTNYINKNIYFHYSLFIVSYLMFTNITSLISFYIGVNNISFYRVLIYTLIGNIWFTITYLFGRWIQKRNFITIVLSTSLLYLIQSFINTLKLTYFCIYLLISLTFILIILSSCKYSKLNNRKIVRLYEKGKHEKNN